MRSGGVRPAPLELSGLAHRFGRRWVLRGVDLVLEPGEAVALTGPNGAGKTTLLRIGATLLRPTRGGGRVGGMDLVDEAAAVRHRVGLLGHSSALYEDLTPEENLAFAYRMRGRPEEPDAIGRILAEVGLGDHARARVRHFSAGMRRRLGLARILTSLPHLLLMDEPFASLDRDGVELVNGVVRRVVAEGGGVLLATHDLESGGAVTDRVVTLEDGMLAGAASSSEKDGTPARLERAAGS